MKKLLLLAVSVLCLVVPSFMFVGCSDTFIKETTYECIGIEIAWYNDLEKAEILDGKTEQEFIDAYYSSSIGIKMTFKTDGRVMLVYPSGIKETYYYDKEGDSIIIYLDEEEENQISSLELLGEKTLEQRNKLEEGKQSQLIFNFKKI